MLFKRLLRRSVLLVQVVLVLIFIVFEEAVWETIAQPIYDYIRDLRLLQAVRQRLLRLNRYVLLVLFLVLLVSVEGAGLLAGVMAVRGNVLLGTLLYGAKIPIAAFTFWMFHATESKLLSFGWFKAAYEWIVSFFAWIKSREIYRETMHSLHRIKERLRRFRQSRFSGENTVGKRFRRLYRLIKQTLFRKGE